MKGPSGLTGANTLNFTEDQKGKEDVPNMPSRTLNPPTTAEVPRQSLQASLHLDAEMSSPEETVRRRWLRNVSAVDPKVRKQIRFMTI